MLTHGNGVTTTQLNDPNSLRRPGRISVSGVVEGTPFDTEAYSYDGSGNVWAMGSDRFQYDLLGQLEQADVYGWQQNYAYDAFGNLTSVTTIPPGDTEDVLALPVATGTNRLTGHSYDGSGNFTRAQADLCRFSGARQLPQKTLFVEHFNAALHLEVVPLSAFMD